MCDLEETPATEPAGSVEGSRLLNLMQILLAEMGDQLSAGRMEEKLKVALPALSVQMAILCETRSNVNKQTSSGSCSRDDTAETYRAGSSDRSKSAAAPNTAGSPHGAVKPVFSRENREGSQDAGSPDGAVKPVFSRENREGSQDSKGGLLFQLSPPSNLTPKEHSFNLRAPTAEDIVQVSYNTQFMPAPDATSPSAAGGRSQLTTFVRSKFGSGSQMIKRTIPFVSESGLSSEAVRALKRPRFMLRQRDPPRVAWDLFMALVLAYVSIMVPYAMGFQDGKPEGAVKAIEDSLDWVFAMDILINFRTGFSNKEGYDVLEWQAAGRHYLRTWFVFDFISTVPWESITQGRMPGMQTLRLTKFTKNFKVIKLIRLGKLWKLAQTLDYADIIDEALCTAATQAKLQLVGIIVFLFLLTHWVACALGFIGNDWFEAYLAGFGEVPGNLSAIERYLVAAYWAMTTMTTVGYGDVLPTCNTERIFAMACMVIGGSFYAYLIGKFASMCSTSDLNRRRYYERMELMQAWMDHHKLPLSLRRRVRRYFKHYLADKAAIDEADVLEDLSPDLRSEIGRLLLPTELRHNFLFSNMPRGIQARLLGIIKKMTVPDNQFIVQRDQQAEGMFVFIDGEAVLQAADGQEELLAQGDSFGEACLLGLQTVSKITVRTETPCQFYMIHRLDFLSTFEDLPDVRKQMQQAFLAQASTNPKTFSTISRFSSADLLRPSSQGHSSKRLPQGFAHMVLQELSDIKYGIHKARAKSREARSPTASRDELDAAVARVVSKEPNAGSQDEVRSSSSAGDVRAVQNTVRV